MPRGQLAPEGRLHQVAGLDRTHTLTPAPQVHCSRSMTIWLWRLPFLGDKYTGGQSRLPHCTAEFSRYRSMNIAPASHSARRCRNYIVLPRHALFALAAISAELGSRHSIANSRSPVHVSDEESASFAYRVDNTFVDSRLVGVLEIEPLREDATLPAGLTQWLEPGHIAVSRAAKHDTEVLERQFGPIQAVIDDTASLKGDMVAYYRPSNGSAFVDLARNEEGVYFSSGFAGDAGEGAIFGEVSYEQWSQYLLPVALLIFAFPLVLNLRATRSSVDEMLAGERFVLESIGAPRRQLIRLSCLPLQENLTWLRGRSRCATQPSTL